MLKTIMGLMKPDSGYTEIFGQPLDKVRERVSYVPQRESVIGISLPTSWMWF